MGWSVEKPNPPSRPGVSHSWRLWRHCCCRYGWWPVVISPIITAGAGFSVYSSAGCDFVRVEVGFTPSNLAWNQSKAELGIFFYQSGEPSKTRYEEAFVGGCRWYEEDFNEAFVNGDRTWRVARVMASISAISGMLATFTSWMFVISPLSAYFWWPGVLLPSLMVSFLAEGSKFLFFDTSICRNLVWYPSGANSLPRVAETCELGVTGYYAIAGAAVFFFCLILVCLKAPHKRELDPHYGMEYDTSNLEHDMESGVELGDYGPSIHSFGEDSGERYETSFDEEPEFYEENYSHSMASSGRNSSVNSYSYTPKKNVAMKRLFSDDRIDSDEDCYLRTRSSHLRTPRNVEDKLGLDIGGGDSRNPSHHKRHTSLDFRDAADEPAVLRMKGSDPIVPKSVESEVVKPPTNLYNPTKPPPPSPQHRISESRKSTIAKMQLNTSAGSEELIEKFVSDLNLSFQIDSSDNRSIAVIPRGSSGINRTKSTREPRTSAQRSFCSPPFCVPQTAGSF